MHEMSDDALPITPEEHEAQLIGLTRAVEHIDEPSMLDLGSGEGRIALPLTLLGTVTAVERSDEHVEALTKKLYAPSTAICIDFTSDAFCPADFDGAPYDAITLLGNTLSMLIDPRDTQRLFQKCADALGESGKLFIDDTPATAWADIAEGNWSAGIGEVEGESVQLCWHETEPIISFRWGPSVDAESPGLVDSDTLLRLYSPSELSLIAFNAGMQGPVHESSYSMMSFRKHS